MAHPLRNGAAPSTAFGARGSHWSCRRDSGGRGIHTGADWPAPTGTPVYAVDAGDVRYRSYGGAFGLQLAVSPDGPGEWFYAHLSWRVPDGTRVEVGDLVGQIGSTGNSTGPHLHLEWHPQVKNRWDCSVHEDPWTEIQRVGGPDDLSTSPSPGGGRLGRKWRFPTGHKVYAKYLTYGGHRQNADKTSDSIKALQEMLNRHSLEGGATVPVSGKYAGLTDAEVIKCQTQHGFGSDTPGESFVGPEQLAHLISATKAPYAVIDGRRLTAAVTATRAEREPRLRGIDISDHQTDIDIAGVDADFVIVKATEGRTYVSPSFEKQYAAAKAAGRLVGIYHFAALNEPEVEADFFLETIGDRVGEAVLVLDWERAPLDDVRWCARWLDRVRSGTGVHPMIYLSESVAEGAAWPVLGACPLWVAAYRTDDQPANYDMSNAGPPPMVNVAAWPDSWVMWQWSANARLDGYHGPLDVNTCSLSADAWKELASPDA